MSIIPFSNAAHVLQWPEKRFKAVSGFGAPQAQSARLAFSGQLAPMIPREDIFVSSEWDADPNEPLQAEPVTPEKADQNQVSLANGRVYALLSGGLLLMGLAKYLK